MPILEKHCTTETHIVVDVRWIVVVAVRYAQVVVVVVVPRPATQNTVISVTFLVTPRHAFIRFLRRRTRHAVSYYNCINITFFENCETMVYYVNMAIRIPH